MGDNAYGWVVQARKYASEHPSVLSVSDIETLKNGLYKFIAEFKINLPGRFDLEGETERGVRKQEPVTFVFYPSFPFKAPEIFLRDDFCRDFPHINPSVREVKPCIYDGDINEFLQQPKWFDNILDQMAEGLEKAAEDNLIDYAQGWEPMRSDEFNGKVWYDRNMISNLEDEFPSLIAGCVDFPKYSLVYKGTFKKNVVKRKEDRNKTKALIFRMPEGKISDRYIPNYINSFIALCGFAQQHYIEQFREKVNEETKGLKIVIIILAIRRPANIIGSLSSLELLNFGLEIKRNKNKKITSSSTVYFLSHRDYCNPELLRRFSGIQYDYQQRRIVQLGCGSLGSKICLHLARNGNDRFFLIDKKYFSLHNNARHALVEYDFEGKAKLLEKHLSKMGIIVVSQCSDAQNLNFQTDSDSLIIDSTASLSVRNFLSGRNILSPIVHTALYDNAKFFILAAESPERNPRINDLIVSIFSECLKK